MEAGEVINEYSYVTVGMRDEILHKAKHLNKDICPRQTVKNHCTASGEIQPMNSGFLLRPALLGQVAWLTELEIPNKTRCMS